MRRCFILILVFLLPLQISWAVAANYCGHEQEKAAHHFGHHDDEHHAAPGVGGDDQQPDSESGNESGLGHHHDHLSGFVALLLNEPALSVFPLPSTQLHGVEPSLTTQPPSQPERPNWSALA